MVASHNSPWPGGTKRTVHFLSFVPHYLLCLTRSPNKRGPGFRQGLVVAAPLGAEVIRLLIVTGQAQLATVEVHNQVVADGRGLALRSMDVMARGAFHCTGSAFALQHGSIENAADGLQLRILGRSIDVVDADWVHSGKIIVTHPWTRTAGGRQGAIDRFNRE